jgi:DNA-directed RNA polymerase specialized sigma24 family protein
METTVIQNPHSMLPIAYRAAAQVVRSRQLAEEAGERAVHLLTLSLLQGEVPEHPKAWLRTVARRSACALLRSEWGRTRSVDGSSLQNRQAQYRIPRNAGFDVVRETLDGDLTPRQRDALRAAVSCNGTRDAARRCGMKPRDFRRSLFSISRKAKRLLAQHGAAIDVSADDAAVLFQLDP